LASIIETPDPMPHIIDSHVHFFDPTRPGGVPWPTRDTPALYKSALPPRLQALSTRFGITGCIAIECSPLLTDNDWLLNIANSDPFVLGIIGDLDPADPAFRTQLERLHKNPLFLGIRYGNLWDRDLLHELSKPHFLEGLRALADAGLVFESANPDPRLIRAILQVAEAVPHLRIVIDHLPNAKVIGDPHTTTAYHRNLDTLAQHPLVYVKLSEIPTIKDGVLIRDKQYYRGKLDPLWNLFAPNRVIFGSDWPNSDQVAPYDQTFAIVSEYMSSKPLEARERYFVDNSKAAYRWHPRNSA
jgi:predicted TIM-barrel fold metal-dependent hydrolase